ncbi:MAG: tRNA pseudouridine(55) synthase TruB [Rhizobiales bacterium]|nr:tRNA pseudouridine(55) synthase TruB [Hyphomicrobiales bacterium]
MGRRKGSSVSGWLIVDKPEGMTSTQAVGKAKWLFDARKAGHAGTLDPLATGILPIALGEATKTVPFIVDGAKGYRFTMRLGIETDSDDSDGQVVANADASGITEQMVRALLPEFLGEIEQTPPRFSAIKVAGERAYDRARDGEVFELDARTVTIDRLDLVGFAAPDVTLEADCGKGTYVRAIARDLGRRLDCGGHVVKLRRTRVGPFDESHAISLERLEELRHSAAGREALMESLLPIEAALDDIPALSVSSDDASRLKRGQPVLLRGRDAPIMTGPVYAMSRGTLVAIGEICQGELRPSRVFNTSAG